MLLTASRQAAALTVTGISKRFSGHQAVHPVSFHVEPGTFVTMLGPSGSGKTTILKMIAGFETSDTGSIAVAGTDVARIPAHKRDIGFVFQQYALFPHLSVRDNIAYPLKMRGVSGPELSQMVTDAAALMKLDGLLDRKPSMLSGGQQQRVALARAVVFRPPLLLMDEPMAALDKRLREEMQVEIRNLQRRLQITTVAVTHDQTEALVMSDLILVLSAGRIEQFGPPSEVYHNPESLFVARFLGESNVVDGLVVDDASGFWIKPANLPPLRARKSGAARSGGKGHYVIRPECISWQAHDGCDVTVAGRVKDALFAGDVLRLTIESPYGELAIKRLHRRSDPIPDPGADIEVSWRSADAVVVPQAD